jgi:hypothetical protein
VEKEAVDEGGEEDGFPFRLDRGRQFAACRGKCQRVGAVGA